MANLTISVGSGTLQVTSTKTASDAKAAQAVRNSAMFHGYQGDMGDNQAVLDYVLGLLVDSLTGWSHAWNEQVAVNQAREDSRNDQAIEFDD
jgi:hypothetical protein